MMTAAEAAEAAKGLTFEKVWVMFQENREQMKEMSREADRRRDEIAQEMREMSKEADRRQAEIDRRQAEFDRRRDEIAQEMREMSREADRRQAETDKAIKELSKNIGGLNNSFGRWAEEMVSVKLWEKFNAIGYTFTCGGPQKYWENDRMVAQVDMLLENGDYAMPVEIKSELTAEDVDDHLKRIAKVREQLDKRGDKRKLIGAVAGMVVAEGVRKYAQKKGLYVVVQSGDTATLAEVPEDFAAREW